MHVATACAAFVCTALTSVPAAAGGPAPVLCGGVASSRAIIPADFAVDGCVTDSRLVLANHTSFVLTLSVSGDASPPAIDAPAVPAVESEYVAEADPHALPPGYTATVSLGSGASHLHIAGAPQSDQARYVNARAILAALPFDPTAFIGRYSALSGLLDSLRGAMDAGQSCLSTAGFLGAAGCALQFTWSATTALVQFIADVGATFDPKPSVGLLLDVVETGLWAMQATHDASAFIHAVRDLQIPAISPVVAPLGPAGGPTRVLPSTNGSGQQSSPRSPAATSDDPDAPPTTDPGQQPLPAGARELGGVDLEQYCEQFDGRHADLRYPNTWGWRCGVTSAHADRQQPGDYNISVDDACAQQYGGTARSHYRSYDDPYSWFCWTTS